MEDLEQNLMPHVTQDLESPCVLVPPTNGRMKESQKEVLDKPSRLTEKELAEAASKWAAEKLEKADESNLPEISEYEAGSTAPLFIDQPEEPESNATDGIELFEDSQLTSRSKAIASKTKEIEQVYRQDCETFGMVVKMLIEKDPSLEKSIQFALRQNLHEIGSDIRPLGLGGIGLIQGEKGKKEEGLAQGKEQPGPPQGPGGEGQLSHLIPWGSSAKPTASVAAPVLRHQAVPYPGMGVGDVIDRWFSYRIQACPPPRLINSFS
ncbi:hypothetical protein CB1_001231002 [Camelus ferus]|nr:hypothetical protein CB1_001231002 [Camelus ferus]